MLQNIGLANQALGTLATLLNPPATFGLHFFVRGAEHDAAGRDRARPAPPEGGRLMQKQAPSVGRVMVMAGFAL